MRDLVEWLMVQKGHHFVQLFEVGDDLITATYQNRNRTVLKRSEDMENAIITVVENGLDDATWQGLFYVMGKREISDFIPLYIGITRRAGGKQKISSNIANIRQNKSKFARWGDGSAYHIGDLSRVLFHGKTSKKYEKWAGELFSENGPPTLKEQVYFYVAPWHQDSIGPLGEARTLDEVEKEMIRIASTNGAQLLNTSGVSAAKKRKTHREFY